MNANYSNTSMLDMVFEHRNKAYGAYVLRRDSNKTIRQAMLSILSVVTMFCAGNFIKESMDAIKQKAEPFLVVAKPADIGKIAPAVQKVKPPVLPPRQPQTAQAIPTVANTERHVVAENAVHQDTIPTNQELANVESGTTTNTQALPGIGATDGNGKEQVFTAARQVDPTPQIYTFVEQMPEFPGGERALQEFIARHTEYPQMERDNDISGKVITQFTVNEDGTVADIRILRSPSLGLSKEAQRVIKMLPAFKPGKQQGRAVKVQFNMPFVFRLN